MPGAADTLDKRYLRRIYWRLTGVIMVAIIVALAAISFLSHKEFERQLIPEMANKAVTVGMSVRALILKAVGYGIEFRSLYGVEQSFEEARSENPEFSYMAATDDRGNILFQLGSQPPGAAAYFADPGVLGVLEHPGLGPQTGYGPQAGLLGTLYVVSLPIGEPDKVLGLLHIGIDQRFVQHIMLELLLDILVLLAVALFLTLELLHFIAGARLEASLNAFAEAMERLKRGDFTRRPGAAEVDEIGRVLAYVEAVVTPLNERYEALARELQQRLRDATAEGRERLREATAAWEALRARFRFGDAAAADAEDPGALARIRAPLFTFILAEELTRAFLPPYVDELLVPVPGISPQVVIGVPIALFMLIVAFGQPVLGPWSERVGRRRAMLAGAILGTLGFAATALAYNLLDLLLWRSICAVGYATVFVSAQGYVLDHTSAANRAQGFALFVGAIMVATVCGPSIGGILADNIGYRLAFGVSAVLCALSIFAVRMLPATDVRPSTLQREHPPSLSDFAGLLLNRRFMTLSGLAAVPAKIILTGFCFYLVPLYMVSVGSNQAMAGRMLMVYAVLMVLLVPVAARIGEQGMRREQLVALGLCISGLGGFLLLLNDHFLMVFGVVFLLGLGQALSIASQGVLVGDLCQEEIQRFGEGAVYGVFRLLERLGNAAGPLLAGLLVVNYSYRDAFVAISALVLGCGLLFSLLTARVPRRPVPVSD